MAGLNRGEWSEFLAILDLLENPQFKVVDSNLKTIDTTTFCLKNIILHTNSNLFKIVRSTNTVEVFKNDVLKYTISIQEITKNKQVLFTEIKENQSKSGSFSIPEIVPFIQKLNENNIIKSCSQSKSDVDTYIFDSRVNKIKNIKYSIKSQLGSPATIFKCKSANKYIVSC